METKTPIGVAVYSVHSNIPYDILEYYPEEWRFEDCCLGDHWGGNVLLYSIEDVKKATDGKLSPRNGQLT